eukprot:c12692_g2_i1 orf=166-360(+)
MWRLTQVSKVGALKTCAGSSLLTIVTFLSSLLLQRTFRALQTVLELAMNMHHLREECISKSDNQ